MKTWKTVFIVFGICLVLSGISGMAYLSPIEVEDKCKPQKNAPNMQSDGVGWVERVKPNNQTCSRLRSGIQNLSPTSIGDPKLDKAAFAQKHRNSRCHSSPITGRWMNRWNSTQRPSVERCL